MWRTWCLIKKRAWQLLSVSNNKAVQFYPLGALFIVIGCSVTSLHNYRFLLFRAQLSKWGAYRLHVAYEGLNCILLGLSVKLLELLPWHDSSTQGVNTTAACPSHLLAHCQLWGLCSMLATPFSSRGWGNDDSIQHLDSKAVPASHCPTAGVGLVLVH